MTEDAGSRATDMARTHYDTDDVDGFYSQAWGVFRGRRDRSAP